MKGDSRPPDPVLDVSEESLLVSLVHQGDSEARNALILDNLAPMHNIARKLHGCFDMDFEDWYSTFILEALALAHKYYADHPKKRFKYFIIHLCKITYLQCRRKHLARLHTLHVTQSFDAPERPQSSLHEDISILREAAETLPSDLRGVFDSFYDLDTLEIKSKLRPAVSKPSDINTIRKRLRLAKSHNHIKKYISKRYGVFSYPLTLEDISELDHLRESFVNQKRAKIRQQLAQIRSHKQ